MLGSFSQISSEVRLHLTHPKSKGNVFALLIMVLFCNVSYGQIANHIVISEVYGGAGNAGAIYSSDYVELYNPTASDIGMSNWSIQYASPGGTTWAANPISGTVKAKGYFLIKLAASTGTLPIPTPDATGTLSVSGYKGKILLASNTTVVTGANPTTANIVDKVGWGVADNFSGVTATGFEGSPGPTTNATNALERKANATSNAASMASGGRDATRGNGYDSDNNNFDFVLSAPNPQNSSSALEEVLPTITTAAISVVAANSATLGGNVTSAGSSVVTERGVVYVASATAVAPTIGTNGHVKTPIGTGGTGSFSQSIKGLVSGTRYYVRAYAINASGTAYGVTTSFTTPKSTDANLFGLTLSAGTLAPTFGSATTVYTASVSSATSSLTVTPTSADGTATITVNGISVASGNASGPVYLKLGDNTITTVVTAQNGSTTKTYTVTVTRSLTDHLVISEVYGGAGNSGATYSSDYVELFNPTAADIYMSNWSIQYASPSGTTWTANTISGTVKAKGYFLIKLLTSTGVSTVPTPDATGSLSLSGYKGKILLASSTTVVTGANPTDTYIVDKVGWGGEEAPTNIAAATGYENSPAPATTQYNALERKANPNSTSATMASNGADEESGNGYDSDDNSFDFVLSTPNPQNSSSPTETMTGEIAVPVITSLSPNSGPIGTLVSVIGTDLNNVTSITFNGTNATFEQTAGSLTTNVPVGATSGSMAVFTKSGVTQLPFSVIEEPLPVTLIHFTGAAISNKVVLNWQTATERDNAYFEVQSTTDLKKGPFITLLRIDSKVINSSTLTSYQAEDTAPAKGATIYYRLKQVDIDGAFEYSKVVAVSMKSSFDNRYSIKLYPNPFTDQIAVEVVTEKAGLMTLILHDETGKKILSKTISVQSGSLSIGLDIADQLRPGLYIVSTELNSRRSTLRLIKQ